MLKVTEPVVELGFEPRVVGTSILTSPSFHDPTTQSKFLAYRIHLDLLASLGRPPVIVLTPHSRSALPPPAAREWGALFRFPRTLPSLVIGTAAEVFTWLSFFFPSSRCSNVPLPGRPSRAVFIKSGVVLAPPPPWLPVPVLTFSPHGIYLIRMHRCLLTCSISDLSPPWNGAPCREFPPGSWHGSTPVPGTGPGLPARPRCAE